MKILYVITRAERGGAQVHVLDLLAHLPPQCRAVVATGEDGYLCQEADRMGIAVRRVPGLVQPVHPVRDLHALLGLIWLIRKERPEVIHAHTSKAGLLARLAAWITSTPVVFTAHTWSFADGIPWFQRRLALPLERAVAALGGKVITVSEANRQTALRQGVGRPEDLICIRNGIPDLALRANPGSRPETTLITVARIAPQKDHLLLFRALAGVTGNWRLLVVGDGPSRRKVEQAAARLNLARRIRFLGDRSDIGKLLSESDIFVLATKWEGLPLSILEAMRAGLPVIASDVGGCREVVSEGVTGFLTPAGQGQPLRERIQRLMNSRQLMRELGAAGRQRYEKEFRVAAMVENTLAAYAQVATSAAPVAITQQAGAEQ